MKKEKAGTYLRITRQSRSEVVHMYYIYLST